METIGTIAFQVGDSYLKVAKSTIVKISPSHELNQKGFLFAEVRGWERHPKDGYFLFLRPYLKGSPVQGKLRKVHTSYISPFGILI